MIAYFHGMCNSETFSVPGKMSWDELQIWLSDGIFCIAYDTVRSLYNQVSFNMVLHDA